MSRITRRGIIPVNQITPLTYRDGVTYIEMLTELSHYIRSILQPSLQSVVDSIVADIEQYLDQANDRYIEGVREFQRIHDAFMSDVNAKLMALNDGAVSDLVQDETSLLGETLRSIFPDRASFDVMVEQHQHTMNEHTQRIDKKFSEVDQRVADVAKIYPEHYGAIGDNKHDDTTALQKWANDGWSTLKPGSTYRVTSSIVFTGDNRKLHGHGATIHSTSDGGSDSHMVVFRGDHSVIEGVTLTALDGKARAGIRVDGDFATITQNVITDFETDQECMGIQIVGRLGGNHVTNNVIRNIYSEGNNVIGDGNGAARGIYFHTPDNTITEQTIIQGNTITNIGGEEGDGIQVMIYDAARQNIPFGSSHTIISGNKITDCSRRYIKVQAGHTIIKGNVCRTLSTTMRTNAQAAINVIRGSRIDISDNTVHVGHHTAGIHVNSPEYIMNFVTVRNNMVYDNINESTVCILLNRAVYSDISGNITQGGSRSVTVGHVTASTITNNTAYEVAAKADVATATGFLATGTCDRVIMANNVDASNRVHTSFSNSSRGGITHNNVSLV